MEDEARFRRFLAETRERALEIADQLHISGEARNVLKDFIEVANQTERLLSDRFESNVDHRMLAKRYDALKLENRQTLARLEKVKEVVTSELAPTVKAISAEAAFVGDKSAQLSDPALLESANRTRAAMKKLIETLTKL